MCYRELVIIVIIIRNVITLLYSIQSWYLFDCVNELTKLNIYKKKILNLLKQKTKNEKNCPNEREIKYN